MNRETLKLIILAILTTFLSISRNPIIIFLFAISTILFSLFLQKSHQNLRKRIKLLIIISFFIIAFQLLFNTPVDIQTRLIFGIIYATKILTLSMLVFTYTSITSPANIIKGLFFLPPKIKLVLSMTMSLLPIIFDEAEKIRLIQLSKGYQRSTINPFKNIFPIIIPLLHRTLQRTEHIALVMQTKGFNIN